MTDATQQALEQGSYDLIKRRLSNFGGTLKTQIDEVNQQRITEFGSTELQVKGRVRVRTEQNCTPRDIVIVGDKVIFAYNVLLGLKKETSINDVFSVQKLVEQDDHFEVEAYPEQTRFLTDTRFIRDFEELYTYYKQTSLQHLYQQNGKLFALFQIGDKLSDVRVFRWEIHPDNTINYIDNRGERDIQHAHDYDFEWLKTDRSDHVEGRHAHINIADQVFVETIGGSLTIKIENSTDTGEGIYQEPVDDKNQSLADSDVEYALVGDLVLIKILPYREKTWRYFIFNTRTQQVARQDAIGSACVTLPEDHGVIFPGGYYLQSGQARSFEEQIEDLEFHRQIKSPNGEDVLYVFYEPSEGRYALFAYNIIDKNLQNPIYCHGYGIYNDGLTLTFKADKDEPERVHPIQIWQSPFVSAEFAANAPPLTSFFGKIGNPDLVRGISDLYSVCKAINEQSPSLFHYEDMIALSRNIFDRYHWLNEGEFTEIAQNLHSINETAEQVLDEFEKVTEIQNKAKQALVDINKQYTDVTRDIRPDSFKAAPQFVQGIDALKILKGQVISLEDIKYIDTDALNALQNQIDERLGEVSQATAAFLQQDSALAPYHEKLKELEELSSKSESVSELKTYIAQLDTQSVELDLLNHTMLDLDIDDSRVRTQILEDISAVYALVNRAKASIEIRQKSLGSVEAKAEFAARFKLFSQSITNALNNAKTPEACDDQLSRLLIQLEELESQFSDFDEYLSEIIAKRDDVYESFEAHKQSLIDTRQRRALNLANAAERILQGVNRRAQSFTELDALNTYFAADPMISKLRALTTELKELGDEIRADDIQSKLKASKDQGIRSLRDKQDIFTDGGNSVSIGKHAFSVNKQLLDLTLLPRDEQLMLHLTGTDYFEPITDEQSLNTLQQSRHLWQQTLVSENDEVYRGEYLAAQILLACENSEHSLTFVQLQQAQKEDTLLSLVQKFAEPRYQEGYEKGIHDHDACAIIDTLLTQKNSLDLLIYPASCRIVAQLFSAQLSTAQLNTFYHQAINAILMDKHFGATSFISSLNEQLSQQIAEYLPQISKLRARFTDLSSDLAAAYLVQQLAQQKTAEQQQFIISQQAKNLAEQFSSDAKAKGYINELNHACENVTQTDERALLFLSWVNAYCMQSDKVNAVVQAEAANYAHLSATTKLHYHVLDVTPITQVERLMGQHKRVQEQILNVDYAEFYARTRKYITEQVPAFEQYHTLRSDILAEQKERLQLDEFKARPLSSFVRNQLINKVYFPIIGDNLAKQIGSAGKNKRTDLMGMLLLISPPGYGKTTLVEYVANRLGLTFVKVNCPSIGHDQVSLDPAQAINATAEKEIAKINQSFEMGNNVMLYLDDIQHTNPEFLQKFISLCDGSRRIDGVWNGKSKTYDLRGKKFAVVMAGNPYTESGESFKIPDMLANRADIYNLGDTLAGCEQEFAMSFIENALTSNSVLAPLANRNMDDLYKLVRICQGEDISLNEMEHGYSQAEANEIKAVLTRLMTIRNTVLKVNAQYIASAAQDNNYRTEPPFKLQGSYRNMNKMAEKVVAAMNDEELENLIRDHYRGEAQTLSKGSEENLLKLGELRGTLTQDDHARYSQIKEDFVRLNKLDGAGSPVMMAVEQMGYLHESLEGIASKLSKNNLSHDYSDLLQSVGVNIQGLDNKHALAALAQSLDNGFKQTPYESGLEQLSAAIASNNNHSQLNALTKATSENNTNQAFNNLEQALGKHLAPLDNKAAITELVAAVSNNNNHSQLNELSKVLTANNSNQSINVLGQQLGEHLAQLRNQDALSELTNAVAGNNNHAQLNELATLVAANNNNQTLNMLSQQLEQMSNAVASNNNHAQLSELAKVVAANNSNQTLSMLGQQLSEYIAPLDNKAQLNELIKAVASNSSHAQIDNLGEKLTQAINSNNNHQQLTQLGETLDQLKQVTSDNNNQQSFEQLITALNMQTEQLNTKTELNTLASAIANSTPDAALNDLKHALLAGSQAQMQLLSEQLLVALKSLDHSEQLAQILTALADNNIAQLAPDLVNQLLDELEHNNNRDVLELMAQQNVKNAEQQAIQSDEHKQALDTLLTAMKNQPAQVITKVVETDTKDDAMPRQTLL
ncbi:DNA repair ATPase [Pseudoalteromonas sp. NEC-BIFX-2020_002]|uniref:DNA repair ATPase n=1 Tax=Pseudoalteromonas sp. NEC-BIFX-2020_002 TaxID=2732353 RepID=UPI002016B0CA|nr:DNA repair ATPase [Pseudoalteromonas sp. NEC-BIFX-2020_002]